MTTILLVPGATTLPIGPVKRVIWREVGTPVGAEAVQATQLRLGGLSGLGVVPTHVVDKLRALVLGMGLSKLHSDGGLACSIVRPS